MTEDCWSRGEGGRPVRLVLMQRYKQPIYKGCIPKNNYAFLSKVANVRKKAPFRMQQLFEMDLYIFSEKI